MTALEALARPSPGVAIAYHFAESVALEETRKFADDIVGREWRFALTQAVEYCAVVAIAMCNRESKTIRAATTRISKPDIVDAGSPRDLISSSDDGGVHDLAADEGFALRYDPPADGRERLRSSRAGRKPCVWMYRNRSSLSRLVNLWPAPRLDELMRWIWAAQRATDKLAA
jgi:hypothetical protein